MTTRVPKGSPTDSVGYLRFLSLLFSYLPTDFTYTADSGRWSEAMFWLRDEYEDKYPGLFEELQFLELPDQPPYSSQISELLTFLQFGNVIEVANPNYRRLHIHPKEQGRIREVQSRKVSTTELETIKMLANDLITRQRDKLIIKA